VLGADAHRGEAHRRRALQRGDRKFRGAVPSGAAVGQLFGQLARGAQDVIVDAGVGGVGGPFAAGGGGHVSGAAGRRRRRDAAARTRSRHCPADADRGCWAALPQQRGRGEAAVPRQLLHFFGFLSPATTRALRGWLSRRCCGARVFVGL